MSLASSQFSGHPTSGGNAMGAERLDAAVRVDMARRTATSCRRGDTVA
jgi:hypothetical protein